MIYTRIYTTGNSTRMGATWYGKPIILSRDTFQECTQWFRQATVSEVTKGGDKEKCDGWHEHAIHMTPLPSIFIVTVKDLL